MSLITSVTTSICSKICYNFSIFSKKKSYRKVKRKDLKKKLLYKMLVKYYLSDNVNAPFENSALGVRNVWAGLVGLEDVTSALLWIRRI